MQYSRNEDHDIQSHHFMANQFSHWVMSDSLWPHGLQHTRLPCPSWIPRACLNSCPSQWCHPPIHPLSSPSPPAFNLAQYQGLFQWIISSYQIAKVSEFQLQHQWIFIPVNIQDWFPLGLTGLISLQPKGLTRVFNTTVQKLRFFSA